jgi:hypothetical protein
MAPEEIVDDVSALGPPMLSLTW